MLTFTWLVTTAASVFAIAGFISSEHLTHVHRT